MKQTPRSQQILDLLQYSPDAGWDDSRYRTDFAFVASRLYPCYYGRDVPQSTANSIRRTLRQMIDDGQIVTRRYLAYPIADGIGSALPRWLLTYHLPGCADDDVSRAEEWATGSTERSEAAFMKLFG